MQLTRMVRETPPGRTVALKTLRDGETRAVKVKVAEHDGEEREGTFHRRIEIPPIEMPDIDLPDIPFLGSVPFDRAIAVAGDQGDPFVATAPERPAAMALRRIAEGIRTALGPRPA